jgi:hypothetical protein
LAAIAGVHAADLEDVATAAVADVFASSHAITADADAARTPVATHRSSRDFMDAPPGH